MVQKKVKEIAWSKNALEQFKEIIEYLLTESEQAAEIVGNTILDEIETLGHNYNFHPKDRFRLNNDGSYRALVVFSYRITYYISNTTVHIIRIRHTSREPLEL